MNINLSGVMNELRLTVVLLVVAKVMKRHSETFLTLWM